VNNEFVEGASNFGHYMKEKKELILKPDDLIERKQKYGGSILGVPSLSLANLEWLKVLTALTLPSKSNEISTRNVATGLIMQLDRQGRYAH
jgi:hypothetical protein